MWRRAMDSTDAQQVPILNGRPRSVAFFSVSRVHGTPAAAVVTMQKGFPFPVHFEISTNPI